MEIRREGWSLALEIRVGGGVTVSQEIRVGGGSKNLAIRRGGVDFFWNNPIGNVASVSYHYKRNLVNIQKVNEMTRLRHGA